MVRFRPKGKPHQFSSCFSYIVKDFYGGLAFNLKVCLPAPFPHVYSFERRNHKEMWLSFSFQIFSLFLPKRRKLWRKKKWKWENILCIFCYKKDILYHCGLICKVATLRYISDTKSNQNKPKKRKQKAKFSRIVQIV